MSFPIGRPYGGAAEGGSSGGGGGGGGGYRTFDELETALLAGDIGDVATLMGPSTWIGRAMKVGASSIRALGLWRLWAADGTEFTVGADGDGDNIETFNGATAPTWGADGEATGGIILDGTGAVMFPCFGQYTVNSLFLCGRSFPTITTPVSGSGWGVAAMAAARTRLSGHGAHYSGTFWYRLRMRMTSAPIIQFTGAQSSSSDMPDMTTLDETLVTHVGMTGEPGASPFGMIAGGAYRGAETGVSGAQQATSSTSDLRANVNDHEITLHCANGGGGDMGVRFSELFIGHMSL